jgi:hypothetical protein
MSVLVPYLDGQIQEKSAISRTVGWKQAQFSQPVWRAGPGGERAGLGGKEMLENTKELG